jgi:putative two-component system response regulator
MNGYEVIKLLKSNDNTVDIPVIFLTANIDPESEVHGLSLGAIDYITKPFSRVLLLKRIEVHLLVEAQRRELKEYNQNLEKMVQKKTKTVFDLQNSILKTVAELVESRDNIPSGHIERTQNFLYILLELLLNNGVYIEIFSKWDLNLFAMSAQLHDVGKISIKDSILLKQGKLTEQEFEEMKMHTIYGVNIIEKIEASTPENAFLKHAKILACSHHEKWDGSGYPYMLKSWDIPLQGRLMAIVDVYDALTNNRPDRKKMASLVMSEPPGTKTLGCFDLPPAASVRRVNVEIISAKGLRSHCGSNA